MTTSSQKIRSILYNRTPETFDAELEKQFRSASYRHMLPLSTVETMKAYLFEGRPTGDFMRAVMNNDLHQSLARADDFNIHALPWIVAFLVNYFPRCAWGDEQSVSAWLKLHEAACREANDLP